MKQQTILHVIGPDRCAKTSIIRRLSKKLGIPSFKASDEHENFLGTQDKFLMHLRYSDVRMLDFIKQTCMSIIFDRSYCCELVYSEYFGRQTDCGIITKLDTEYAALGAKILFCTRRSFAGIEDDLDKSIDALALIKISALYDQFVEWTQCGVMKVYVDEEKKNDIVKRVKTWVKS